jgi:hypothetical protein
MTIVMNMFWEGVTTDQYEQLRKLVNWEGNVPRGAISHIASFSERGIHVTDLWESAEDFQEFTDTRLMPGVRQLGVDGQPEIEIRPVHALFTPARQRV